MAPGAIDRSTGTDPRAAEPSGRLPVLGPSAPSAGLAPRPPRAPPRPVEVGRGVVLFDLDGTLLDDLPLIADVAADVMHQAFGTEAEEARIHYLATTGMPFEAQLSQLYPSAPTEVRAGAARTFHQRKVTEAYAQARPFPEVPRVLNTLHRERWTLVVATGSETEMADLLLERVGLRYWFEEVFGSGDGTKREHLVEYRRRYPEAPMCLVGDSRFDMEAALSAPGVTPVARASRFPGWTLTPRDLRKWGAAWAAYDLSGLPAALGRLLTPPRRTTSGRGKRASRRRA